MADPMAQGDPMALRCSAHSKQSGAQCRHLAISGGRVCRHHGGAAPQVRAAAQARLQALVDPAIDTLGHLVRQRRKLPGLALAASRDVLDRTGLAAPKDDAQVVSTTNVWMAVLAEMPAAQLKALHIRMLQAGLPLPSGTGNGNGSDPRP